MFFKFILSKSLDLVGCQGDKNGNISLKNKKKFFSSETIREMKLILSKHVFSRRAVQFRLCCQVWRLGPLDLTQRSLQPRDSLSKSVVRPRLPGFDKY